MSSDATAAARYTWPAIALHWIVAVLVFGGFALGLYMSDLPVSPQKLRDYSWHKWSGITVLALALLRILWRLTHPPPPLPASIAQWQRRASALAHLALYALLFLIPLSGWMYSSATGYPVVYFGIKGLRLPDLVTKNKELAGVLKDIHIVLNWSLAALVSIHIAAALKHHWLDRDDSLRRILPLLRSRR